MRLVLFFLWILRWLPLSWVAALGTGLGSLLFRWGRRRVSLINLRRCFPEKTEAEREAIARSVFQHLARATLRMGRLWYAPLDGAEGALAGVRIVGREHADPLIGHVPTIILAPHFVGLDVG